MVVVCIEVRVLVIHVLSNARETTLCILQKAEVYYHMELRADCVKDTDQFQALLDEIGPCSASDHGGLGGTTLVEESSSEHKRHDKHERQRREEIGGMDVIDEMEQIIKDRECEVERLKVTNKKAKQRIRELERRSHAITTEMAKVMEEKGNFENLNDEFSNSNITEKFYKLYDNDWVYLSRRLGKLGVSLTELELIHHLTQMMKFVYEECGKAADSQIRLFFLLTENEPTPLQEDNPELFSLRRKYARTEAVRNRLVHEIWLKLKTTEEISAFDVGANKAEVVNDLKKFFDKYIDCCWLIIVSNPPLRLDFDVIGRNHSECIEHFRIYSPKQPVIDPMKEEGTIYEVVWPSICLQNGGGCYKKGEVVIIQTAKKTDNVCNNDNMRHNKQIVGNKNNDQIAVRHTMD
ncbi:uncharacterized protein LOC132723025 isoform X2 [Ruditapes philippinarum]|uniref:uncharacterized protein LOC132723025 isoform X2 n=1 Tax=Ruditapes philippinarum TaxID=129788 RepID=UPI00295BFF6E|nr:uncharacterized protein LOC132723025 isoform X2 [Ruditapes philippinarum]